MGHGLAFPDVEAVDQPLSCSCPSFSLLIDYLSEKAQRSSIEEKTVRILMPISIALP